MDRTEQCNPAATAGDVWERYKDEIGWLYERMTLKAVKEHMEQDGRFPSYSLSMWKKKVGRWGFDTKNNKRSTIEAAVAHFQARRPDQTSLPFAPACGKVVSEEELNRYLRRSKAILNNGKLMPRAKLHVEQATSSQQTKPTMTQEDVLKCEPHSPGTMVDSSDTMDSPESSRNDDVQYVTIPRHNHYEEQWQISERLQQQRRLALHRRQYLRKIKMAYLFGHGFVRPTDLVVPESFQRYHAVLKGVEDSIRSSWDAGLWSVDEGGFFAGSSGEVHMNQLMSGFENGYYGAALFRKMGAVSRARKLLFKGLECLLIGLNYVAPDAIWTFLDQTLRLFDKFEPESIQVMLRACAALVESARGVYPGIRQFISALASTPPDELIHTIRQACRAWSHSFETSERHLNWSARVGIWRIRDDPSLSREEKHERLFSFAADLLLNPSLSPLLTSECLEILVSTYFRNGNLEDAKSTIESGLVFLRKEACIQEWLRTRLVSHFIHWRAFLCLREGNVQGAIGSLQEILLSVELEQGDKLFYTNLLAEWYLKAEDESMAQKVQNQSVELIDSLQNLDLECLAPEQMAAGTNLQSPGLLDDHLSIGSDSECPSEEAYLDVEQTWQSYIDGEEYELGEGSKAQSEWRSDTSPLIREHLTLSEPMMDIEMELLTES